MDKKHDLESLKELYRKAEDVDTGTFADMKTNLLMYSGEHYARKHATLLTRTREYQELPSEQKLRITKNHTLKICKSYVNNVVESAPGVVFSPKNDKELQDQKAAELHNAVWADAKERYDLQPKIEEWCEDFVTLGECAVKILWEPMAGDIVAYEQAVDAAGKPLFEEDGTTPKAGAAVYEGDFVFERIYGFNLLRSEGAKDMEESPFLISRKMVGKKDLVKQFPEHESKISDTKEDTYVVFDGNLGKYRKTDKEVLVKEYYFKKCVQYPQGYFFITCGEAILAEGELPGGVFPIVWQYFDRVQTSARGFSIIKTVRPYQAEINRASSKIAEHQITLGDDKLLIQTGTNVSSGVSLPGVRTVSYSGLKPDILQGRSGDQYLNYMTSQIKELYAVCDISEEEELKMNTDPNLIIYRAAHQKRKFVRYHKRFERFLKGVAKTYISLAKLYMPEQRIVEAVGRREIVNISEFKGAPDSGYELRLEPQAEDIETKLGRQIFMNQILQYVGSKLDKEDIGKIIRSAPYSNVEEIFGDMTLNYDMATNIILALDRGQMPAFSKDQDHLYILKRLTNRMLLSDFMYLPPQVQALYVQRRGLHEEMQAQIIKETQMLESGFIPTAGYLVACDFYVPINPEDPSKTKRVRLPSASLQWLIDKLATQGQTLDALEDTNQGLVAELANRVTEIGGNQPLAQAPGAPISQAAIGEATQPSLA